jgi:hypothetical protein
MAYDPFQSGKAIGGLTAKVLVAVIIIYIVYKIIKKLKK